MKSIKLLIPTFVATSLLSGCNTMLAETFFAHYRLSEQAVTSIAYSNAGVNICLANNAIDKNIAYAYSNVSAQMLDISVIDREFYRQSYQRAMDQGRPMIEANPSATCAQLEPALVEATKHWADTYIRVSTNLNTMRAQERQQMATMMANFGSNRPPMQMNFTFPSVSYVEVAPTSATNYLMHTSKGMIQCRVTSKNYVFCI